MLQKTINRSNKLQEQLKILRQHLSSLNSIVNRKDLTIAVGYDGNSLEFIPKDYTVVNPVDFVTIAITKLEKEIDATQAELNNLTDKNCPDEPEAMSTIAFTGMSKTVIPEEDDYDDYPERPKLAKPIKPKFPPDRQ